MIELGTAPVFEAGFDSLTRELGEIRRRIERGRPRADDLESLDACSEALAELRALYRAELRKHLEGDGELLAGLDLALVTVEELLADGLTLRTIPPAMRDELRTEREADYSFLLYGFAGSGGSLPLRRP